MIDKPGVQAPAEVQPAITAAIAPTGKPSDSSARQGPYAGPAATSAAPVLRLLERIKNLTLAPKFEWRVIAPEPTSAAQLYIGYIMPLAAFAAVMSFLHVSLVGVSVPLAGVIREPVAVGLKSAIYSFGFGLLGTFLIALLIDALAPTFAGSCDRRQALKVTAYSFTPAWLSAVLALSPILPTLLQWIALFYGIYVLYLGLPLLMRSPPERALGYTATVVACTLLLGCVFLGLSIAVGRFGGATGSLSSSPAAQAAAQDRGAATVGNIIGNALGTDDKGKAGLGSALSNLVKAGQANDPPGAAAEYQSNDGAAVHIEISDISGVSGLMDAAGSLVHNTTSESATGFEETKSLGAEACTRNAMRKRRKAVSTSFWRSGSRSMSRAKGST